MCRSSERSHNVSEKHSKLTEVGIWGIAVNLFRLAEYSLTKIIIFRS